MRFHPLLRYMILAAILPLAACSYIDEMFASDEAGTSPEQTAMAGTAEAEGPTNLMPAAGNANDVMAAPMTKLVFNAMEIRMADDTMRAKADSNAEHLLSVAPAQMTESWLRDHVAVTGTGPHNLRLHIREAQIHETPITKENAGFMAWFHFEPDTEYKATADIMVEILGDNGQPIAYAQARAEQTQTALENLNLAERRVLLEELTSKLLESLGQELNAQARQYLSAYLAN